MIVASSPFRFEASEVPWGVSVPDAAMPAMAGETTPTVTQVAPESSCQNEIEVTVYETTKQRVHRRGKGRQAIVGRDQTHPVRGAEAPYNVWFGGAMGPYGTPPRIPALKILRGQTVLESHDSHFYCKFN